jgi:ubiquinone/menaquinone biosynthesis C-methylase UbiE
VPALGFAALTPFYDAVMGITMREGTFRPALADAASVLPGQEVLDLACGTGTLAVMIAARARDAKVSGVDADPEVLAIAERKARRAGVTVRLDQGLSNRLPYPDESFHCVVSSLFFHHLAPERKRETAREVLRVLRPGGELHVADWGRASNALMRALFVPVQLLDGFANTRENVSGGLPAVFEEAGFEDVRQTRSFSTVFGTLALYRAAKPGIPAVRHRQ